ncbi:hypothetical protein ACEQPO_04970 [Bacillus sp. SL00103]
MSDKDAVQKAVELAHTTFGDLHGVIHAAGERQMGRSSSKNSRR